MDDERILGHYTASLLQRTDTDWSPLALPLDAISTNFRLILRPLRKRYRPASLPSRYIKQVTIAKQGIYQCIGLNLTTDDWLYLIVSTGSLENLYDDIHAMKLPPPRFQFDGSIAREDIERLITYFGKQPR